MRRLVRLTTLSLLASMTALGSACAAAPEEAPEEALFDNCSYPQSGDRITDADPLPRAAWPDAYRADGSTFRFSMNDVHQSIGEWSPFDVLVFVAIPTW